MDYMSQRIVSQQLADYVAEHGGATVNLRTGEHAQGPGFVVAEAGREKKVEGKVTPNAADIQEFLDEHGPAVADDPTANLGVWNDTMDISRSTPSGAEARSLGRQNLQEAVYALGSVASPSGTPTRLNPTDNTDTIHRPFGTDVLINLNATANIDSEARRAVSHDPNRVVANPQKRKDETPVFRDMADRDMQADETWRRDGNPNNFNRNEFSSDAWEITNKENPLSMTESRGRPGDPEMDGPRSDGERRRTNLGDVLRTINEGRTRTARGEGIQRHPVKGWYFKKPQKVSPQFDRVPVEYNEKLEQERPNNPAPESDDAFRERNQAAGQGHIAGYIESLPVDAKTKGKKLPKPIPKEQWDAVVGPDQTPPPPRGRR